MTGLVGYWFCSAFELALCHLVLQNSLTGTVLSCSGGGEGSSRVSWPLKFVRRTEIWESWWPWHCADSRHFLSIVPTAEAQAHFFRPYPVLCVLQRLGRPAASGTTPITALPPSHPLAITEATARQTTAPSLTPSPDLGEPSRQHPWLKEMEARPTFPSTV